MADINQVISLGIGTPADIKHLILVGLSPNVSAVNATALGIGTEVLAESGTAVAVGTGGAGSPWVGYEPRDLYAPRLVKKLKRETQVPAIQVSERVDAVAVGIGVETYVRTGKAKARGTQVIHARAHGIGVEVRAAVGRAIASGSASARGRFPGDDDDEVLAWILSVAA
jgi:hypothetical protein